MIFTAVTILYPLILIKTRVQSARKAKDLPGSQPSKSSPSQTSPINIASEIIKREGVKGLYQGLEAQLIKGVISQGLTLSTKQRCSYSFASRKMYTGLTILHRVLRIEDNFVRLYRYALQRGIVSA